MSLLPIERWFDNDNFFDRFFAPQTRGEAFFSPRVDVIDKEDHYEITAELPGVKKEDIHVELHDGILTLNASMNEEKSKETDKIIRKERRSGQYSRSFNVGDNISENDISAHFVDGVLKLTAPKMPERAKEVKRVTIR